MEQHDGLIASIHANASERGSALLLTQSKDTMSFVGTCNTPGLLDLIETMFRASPNVKALFDEASARAEWPVS